MQLTIAGLQEGFVHLRLKHEEHERQRAVGYRKISTGITSAEIKDKEKNEKTLA